MKTNIRGAICLAAVFLLLICGIVFFKYPSEKGTITTARVKRNGAIELMRFIICMSVVLHHYGTFSPHGYLGVDFFFVLSGYLLMQHFAKHEHLQGDAVVAAAHYTKSRYFRIIPFYLVAFCLSVILHITLQRGLTLLSFIKITPWELLMLEAFGITDWTLIGPGWYCSALLIAGFFVYFLLNKHRKLYIYLIAPTAAMLVFVLMYRSFGNLNRWTQVDTFISMGTLRGFAELGIGCICYEIVQALKDKIPAKLATVSSLVECLCIIFMLCVIYKDGGAGCDFVYVLVVAVLTISFFIGNSYLSKWLNNCVCIYLGKISLGIYLNHAILGMVDWYKILGISWNKALIVYLALSVIFSAVSIAFVETLLLRRKTRFASGTRQKQGRENCYRSV